MNLQTPLAVTGVVFAALAFVAERASRSRLLYSRQRESRARLALVFTGAGVVCILAAAWWEVVA